MKYIIILLALLLSTLTFANSGTIEISGFIKNSTFDTVSIKSISNATIESAEVDPKGNFNLKLSLEKGFYLLKYGRESVYIYVYPNDKLEISFDAKNFNKTLCFSGDGAQRNNYLVHKAQLMEKMTEDINSFYDVSETKYLENLLGVKERLQKELKQIDVEPYFMEDEEKSLQYNYLLSIQNFKTSYTYYLGKEIKLSNNFYSELKGIDLRNMQDYKWQPYYYYLVNSIWSKRINKEVGFKNMSTKLLEIKEEEVINSVFNGFYSQITRDKAKAKDYFKLIKKYSTSKEYIAAAKKQMESLFLIGKGDVSPSFTYMDIKKKEVSLSDFKGKLIYMDVWATWCAPCKKQIPYLQKLEEYFDGQDIVFISISVDKIKAYENWENMVREQELGGIQLFADNSFDSPFMKAYGINSIPRFIIVDKDGNVYDDKAPSPSFEKTKVLLEQLLK